MHGSKNANVAATKERKVYSEYSYPGTARAMRRVGHLGLIAG